MLREISLSATGEMPTNARPHALSPAPTSSTRTTTASGSIHFCALSSCSGNRTRTNSPVGIGWGSRMPRPPTLTSVTWALNSPFEVVTTAVARSGTR